MNAVKPASAIRPRNRTLPGSIAARWNSWRTVGTISRSTSTVKEPSADGDEREHGRHRPHASVVTVMAVGGRAAQHPAEHRPEREPAVDRDRPVAHRLAPPVNGREIGDHGGRTHEEPGLAEAGHDPHHDEVPLRVHEAVARHRHADHERAADDEDAAAQACHRASPRTCGARSRRPRTRPRQPRPRPGPGRANA